MSIFRFFQDGGRQPSWICDAQVWTTREGHLVVFITVQNLAEIDAISIIDHSRFNILPLRLEIAYSRSQNWGSCGQNRGRGGAMLTLSEFVLTFSGRYLRATFGENRSRNATVKVRTDRRTHALTETD